MGQLRPLYIRSYYEEVPCPSCDALISVRWDEAFQGYTMLSCEPEDHCDDCPAVVDSGEEE